MNSDTTTQLICPVCRGALRREERAYVCANRHSYDIAKKGYVNLMMSQRSNKKRHGDDKLMLNARTEFLNKGYYKPLAEAIVQETLQNVGSSAVIIDAGCGEGYYTAMLHQALPNADIYGIDISKDALAAANRRDRSLTLAAASAADIPAADGCADAVLSIFAPVFPQEIIRLLKPGGVLVRAVPLEEHLFGLKQAVYDRAYKNPHDSGELDGLTLISRRELRFTLYLDSTDDITHLFMMTPYYYKTSRADQEKLLDLSQLTTEAAFGVLLYKK